MRIRLPDGSEVHARAGKYLVPRAPDLNDVCDRTFFLEYDFPFLLVREIAVGEGFECESLEARCQAADWNINNPNVGGFIELDRSGYQFNQPASRRCPRDQFTQNIPCILLMNELTWNRLSRENKEKIYKPCVPTVMVELMPASDTIASLAGESDRVRSREAMVVYTRRNRVWVYNHDEQPFFTELSLVEIDSWPGFSLHCVAIRDTRVRHDL